MNARDDERDGGTPERHPSERKESPYPLLFKGTRPRAPKTFVDRIAALFRSTHGEEETSMPPPTAAEARSRQGGELGSVSDPLPVAPASPPVDTPVETEPSAAHIGKGDRPPSEGADPNPTALHRATLQMLPGRLQSLDGKVLAQEIRFLRPNNAEHAVTLGRDRAAPPDHIAVDHPSLRPRHARMRYRLGEWWIESLVKDDPVRVNDRPVSIGHPQRLGTGDRLGLGSVELRYMGT